MAKHSFSAAERYAVFTVHGEKCYLCGDPKNQGWSQEKHEKDMRYHIYQVTSYEETANTVRFKAYYQGIE